MLGSSFSSVLTLMLVKPGWWKKVHQDIAHLWQPCAVFKARDIQRLFAIACFCIAPGLPWWPWFPIKILTKANSASPPTSDEIELAWANYILSKTEGAAESHSLRPNAFKVPKAAHSFGSSTCWK